MRRVLLSRRWLVRHALALVLVAVCLRLGWWQWERAAAAGGNAQNLAYALQWPLFAGFVVFAWWRMLRYEVRPPLRKAPHQKVAEVPSAGRRTVEVRRRYTPPVVEAEPDERLDAYNRYLAQLNAQDARDTEDTEDTHSTSGIRDADRRPRGEQPTATTRDDQPRP